MHSNGGQGFGLYVGVTALVGSFFRPFTSLITPRPPVNNTIFVIVGAMWLTLEVDEYLTLVESNNLTNKTTPQQL